MILLFLLLKGFWVSAQNPLPLIDESREEANYAWESSLLEEFSDSKLNTKIWNTQYYGDGVYTNWNNGNDCYYKPKALQFKNGTLSFMAQYEPTNYVVRAGNPTLDDGILNYTSGMISSHQKFSQQYGFFEVRMKIPKGKGIWPTFWLMPANLQKSINWLPEVDIMENFGNDSLVFTTHRYDEALQKDVTYAHEAHFPNLHEEYHTYGLMWLKNNLTWYVDGKWVFFTSDASYIPQEPMYIILNLAIGGHHNYPTKKESFKAQMDIEYVRVWQLKN